MMLQPLVGLLLMPPRRRRHPVVVLVHLDVRVRERLGRRLLLLEPFLDPALEEALPKEDGAAADEAEDGGEQPDEEESYLHYQPR